MLPWVHPLTLEPDHAFPSGHATFFMSLASTLWFYHKRLALFFGLSAIFIGITRIAVGVHWPGDILGGLFLGLLVGTTPTTSFPLFQNDKNSNFLASPPLATPLKKFSFFLTFFIHKNLIFPLR